MQKISKKNTVSSSGNGRFNLVDGNAILPKGFIKHVESRTRLNSWLEAHPDQMNELATENREAGPTLMERHNNLRVERSNWGEKLTFSTSIEQKRIDLLSRTIAHLENATPDAETRDAIQGFQHHVPDIDELLRLAKPQVSGQVSRVPYSSDVESTDGSS